MDIQPLADIVIVKMARIEPEKRGSLVLPALDPEQQQIRWGEVIAVGPGSFSQFKEERVPIDVKVGDFVGINGHAPAIKLVEESVEYLLVNAPSIICFSQLSRDLFVKSSVQE